MSKKRTISLGIITAATVIKAISEIEKETGYTGHTAADIGFYLQRPEGYDLGGKLYALDKKGLLSKVVVEGKRNTYATTEEGIKYLAENMLKVQKYGCYEEAHERRTLSPKRSQTALDAIAMLQKHIADNEKVLIANQQIVNIIDDLLEEIGE